MNRNKRASLERSGTSARLTLALTRFPDDCRANFRTFVTFQRKTHFTFHRRTVPFRTRNFYFEVAKQNVSPCTWTCRAKLGASLITRTWQTVRSDLTCLLIVAFACHVFVLQCSAGSSEFPRFRIADTSTSAPTLLEWPC